MSTGSRYSSTPPSKWSRRNSSSRLPAAPGTTSIASSRRLTRTVREHRAFRPLYYNIADELGHGDQIQPVDFCHSPHCTARFAEYLRDLYGSTDRVAAEWGGREAGRWDDEILKSGSDWRHEDLMIARTTTDRAFDLIAAASLRAKYGSII